MGRVPFGNDQMLAAVKKIAEGKERVSEPMKLLEQETGLGAQTIKKYLVELEKLRYFRLHWNERGGQIVALYVLKATETEWVTAQRDYIHPAYKKPVAPHANSNGGGQSPKPIETKQVPSNPPDSPQGRPKLLTELLKCTNGGQRFIAVLVDYDNFISNIEFEVSFYKLKNLVRNYGNILFSEMFVSPTSHKNELVQRIHQSGFTVISCPMATKDKDGVDKIMQDRAQAYMLATAVDTIVIISRDSDFYDLANKAADVHKTVVFIDPAAVRFEIQGTDEVVHLEASRSLSKFSRAAHYLTNGLSGIHSWEQQHVQYLHAIIDCLNKIPTTTPAAFKYMDDFLESNFGHWNKS